MTQIPDKEKGMLKTISCKTKHHPTGRSKIIGKWSSIEYLQWKLNSPKRISVPIFLSNLDVLEMFEFEAGRAIQHGCTQLRDLEVRKFSVNSISAPWLKMKVRQLVPCIYIYICSCFPITHTLPVASTTRIMVPPLPCPKWSSNMAARLRKVGQVKRQGVGVGGMMFLENRPQEGWKKARSPHGIWMAFHGHVNHLKGYVNKKNRGVEWYMLF